MKMGDQVQVYPHDRPEQAADGIVISVADHGNSIAVTLMRSQQHLTARRQGEGAPWINLENGQPIEIV